jgi:hypothetical protein
MKINRAIHFAVGMAVLLTVIAGPVFAHPMTFQGTVLAVEPARVQVKTVAESKKEEDVWFVVNKDTKVKRGDTTVKYADAQIAKGERIVVTIDHDAKIKMLATEIRLAAK